MFLLLTWLNQCVVSCLNYNSSVQYPAMICLVSAQGSLNHVFTRFKDFVLRLWANHFCSFLLFLLLVINSVQLSPALSQSATDCANYDIGHYKFMWRHSGVIIIDFDEIPEHALLAIFSWYKFWFGNSVGVIYSRSQELALVVFPVHILTESHPILSYYIVTVTLCGFVSHILLFIFGRVC